MQTAHHYYHDFTVWLHAHPYWGLLAAFVIALAESLPIIGLFVPGSVVMTAVGILVGGKILPVGATILVAAAGAVFGDSVGFLLGYRYRLRVQTMWPFRTRQHWLERGKSFIRGHGGKSVFAGRFIGPLRPIVPLIAGMLHMRPLKFYLADVSSAPLWAIAYMLPGFLVGMAAVSLPADLGKQLLVGTIIILLAVWLAMWLLRFLYRRLHRVCAQALDTLWQTMHRHRSTRMLRRILWFAERPRHAGQLVSACVCLVLATALVVLSAVALQAHVGDRLPLNHTIYHILHSLHYPPFSRLMATVTLLGAASVLLPAAGVLCAYLLATRRWRLAWHWAALIFLTAGGVFIFKHVWYSVRPPALAQPPQSSSFPGGHVALSLAVYGFLAYLAALRKPSWQRVYYYAAAAVVAIIAFSRLYLYAHWFTDIVGALLLGGLCLTTVIISHRRRIRVRLPMRRLLTVFLPALLVFFGIQFWHERGQQPYRLLRPVYNVATVRWWAGQTDDVPHYVLNRLGHPARLLNVQWAGAEHEIRAALTDAGWRFLSAGYFFVFYKEKTRHKASLRVMATERLNGAVPGIVAMKTLSPQRTAVLYLWPAHILLAPDDVPLWVGTLYRREDKRRMFWHRHPPPVSELATLLPAIEKGHYKILAIPTRFLPPSWRGRAAAGGKSPSARVLLIRSP